MPRVEVLRKDIKTIESLVEFYETQKAHLELFMENLTRCIRKSEQLMEHVHSVKWRLKDPGHLRDKLMRKAKALREKGQIFDVTKENLFDRITDPVGIRILHLHTEQFIHIHRELLRVLEEQQYRIAESAEARSWDSETEAFFKKNGIAVRDSQSMYTSVHYVVEANSRAPHKCEIQVRTLMEEVWGEVDHSMNYPHAVESIACREQIKALARVTSSCSRLVDSIFRSHVEFGDLVAANRQSSDFGEKSRDHVRRGSKSN